MNFIAQYYNIAGEEISQQTIEANNWRQAAKVAFGIGHEPTPEPLPPPGTVRAVLYELVP